MVNHTDGRGRTLLHRAAKINRLNTVDCSLKWAPIIYALISLRLRIISDIYHSILLAVAIIILRLQSICTVCILRASTNQISLDFTLCIVCLVMHVNHEHNFTELLTRFLLKHDQGAVYVGSRGFDSGNLPLNFACCFHSLDTVMLVYDANPIAIHIANDYGNTPFNEEARYLNSLKLNFVVTKSSGATNARY